MSNREPQSTHIDISIANIGGIDETEAQFDAGVTVLSGRNATNRTSFLQGIMAGLGSNDVSMKADADDAHIELTTGNETYTREFERVDGTIRTDGDPYLEEPLLADLFAFLLESNEARRAVTTETDLRDLIMQPIDTDEINAEIDQLVDRRRSITQELEAIDDSKKRLPKLEEERTRLEAEIESTAEQLAETEAELESFDEGVEQTREEKNDVEAKLSELQDKRGDLESVRYEIETERESLDSLRREQSELADEADALPDAPMGEYEDIEAQIDRLRTRKQRLESKSSELQSVIQFNEEMLEESGGGLVSNPGDGNDGAVTDQLVADDSVTCWTCGSTVDADQIEETISMLQSQSQETFGEISNIEDELAALTERRAEIEQQQRERERIDRRQDEIDAEIETTTETIDRLTDRRDDLRDEIATLEAAIEEQEADMREDVLALHRQANQYEYDLGTLETQLEEVESEISEIEGRLEDAEDLEADREAIVADIEELRTRIERIERTAIEEFNDHMDTVLERLGYENIDRIWLERTETQVTRGRRTEAKSTFELHIVRQTTHGTTYEDTVDHLSESEREVVGLVFALAGYLVHEVYEEVPFLLLDSLEAIDSERIAALIDYLQAYTPYLVVALLDEDAAALDDAYTYMSVA
ncbi:chromosome segregation protein SMC [Salinadaptatus halalkaliphilus]|uniref:Chromosome segregation protein SMC n=1 Tax=Salinadaptatus halalkaliphilus TaxID=2419781 RepID=A0A4S3TJU0_9EURY|nr:archaea-specific SMC-related protein [Salinadaptatus halalkaliphilus]THE63513.1 chromosome segregation protein SMC [Salinadaptatus halalkaliphilus]